ncbi:hypothetical protein ASE70_17065 [Sphingomonas sp. Leaf22]|nr:hypothetical protein ASE70_17065 [Sphingomonas sp. Leaf22]
MADDVHILFNIDVVSDAQPRQRILTMQYHFDSSTVANDRTFTNGDTMWEAHHILSKDDAALADPAVTASKHQCRIKSAHPEA